MTTAILDSPLASTQSVSAGSALHLVFDAASKIHDGLDQAVSDLMVPAREAGSGILVTRTSPGHYTVAVDSSVPFGQVQEDIAA
ncbi:hypothetical protein [Pseudarthrobacter sp. PS3-L1]|uniref:hypothetical protein n=1 Tax=Pseudarthrobacter sp. PS3-L1 TaxID=3046207 RepID=UPI0024BB6EDB|nr:hypothetical protein [Pseudarthrobacter sp. PS3-L1]MDJ0320646.1 hypothetical protein [Pseudarthrobacter sp. PS3-L1]